MCQGFGMGLLGYSHPPDGYPPFEHMERPERVASVVRALERAGAEFIEVHSPVDLSVDELSLVEPALLRTLHEPAYVDFLKEFCAGIG